MFDKHLDCAGVAQTHFGLFARSLTQIRPESHKGNNFKIFFKRFGFRFGTSVPVGAAVEHRSTQWSPEAYSDAPGDRKTGHG